MTALHLRALCDNSEVGRAMERAESNRELDEEEENKGQAEKLDGMRMKTSTSEEQEAYDRRLARLT